MWMGNKEGMMEGKWLWLEGEKGGGGGGGGGSDRKR